MRTRLSTPHGASTTDAAPVSKPAVAQSFQPANRGRFQRAQKHRRPADWKSALRHGRTPFGRRLPKAWAITWICLIFAAALHVVAAESSTDKALPVRGFCIQAPPANR